ncbi:MAG: hypothetical protein AAB368_13865, partial [bacterium]
ERARLIKREERAFEDVKMAEHHESKAAGLERQLDRSVFSDDTDAIERLEARIAQHEKARDQKKRINALYRKGDASGLAAMGLSLDTLRAKCAAAGPYWGDKPFLAYELTNLGARIRSDKERIEEIKRRQVRTEAAEASGGVSIEGAEGSEYVRVTFAEKPERDVLDALRGAGFWWGGGSWSGKRAALPAEVSPCAP